MVIVVFLVINFLLLVHLVRRTSSDCSTARGHVFCIRLISSDCFSLFM
jgi:hypothetical protein